MNRFFHKRKRLKSKYIFNQSDINKVMFSMPPMSVVISDFTSLKKCGNEYGGRCPICKPLTTNNTHLRVSDKKNLYKCFECGAGGTNSISFLMRYFNSPFGEILFFVNKAYTKLDITPQRIRSLRSNIDDDLPF